MMDKEAKLAGIYKKCLLISQPNLFIVLRPGLCRPATLVQQCFTTYGGPIIVGTSEGREGGAILFRSVCMNEELSTFATVTVSLWSLMLKYWIARLTTTEIRTQPTNLYLSDSSTSPVGAAESATWHLYAFPFQLQSGDLGFSWTYTSQETYNESDTSTKAISTLRLWFSIHHRNNRCLEPSTCYTMECQV